jgi:hypothetical protein
VRDGQRFVVHIDHAEIVGAPACDLVYLADRGDARPQVQELPNPVVDQVFRSPAQECAVFPVDLGDAGQFLLDTLDKAPFHTEVVAAAKERVVDPGSARQIEVHLPGWLRLGVDHDGSPIECRSVSTG